ncbi:MAG: hypothetical protein M3Y37_10750 [Chloroflexota bacterium]|nr:hypothetical protein [Chloroflexota bacterium]
MAKFQSSDMIDGVDGLHKRDRTRLWYRARSPIDSSLTRAEALPAGKPLSALRIIKAESPTPSEQARPPRTRITAELAAILDSAPAPAQTDTLIDESHALTEWRDAPVHCPVLLLSASSILDARNPGPILGPGTSYRILSVNDGVAALKVASLDGQIGVGYCNAVDLICFEPDIVYYRRERQTGKLGTARLGLNKLSQRISGVTSALAH